MMLLLRVGTIGDVVGVHVRSRGGDAMLQRTSKKAARGASTSDQRHEQRPIEELDDRRMWVLMKARDFVVGLLSASYVRYKAGRCGQVFDLKRSACHDDERTLCG